MAASISWLSPRASTAQARDGVERVPEQGEIPQGGATEAPGSVSATSPGVGEPRSRAREDDPDGAEQGGPSDDPAVRRAAPRAAACRIAVCRRAVARRAAS
ncbi:hypothetical protein ACU4GR_02495 [Methylobacterium oryzae CBMB20]